MLTQPQLRKYKILGCELDNSDIFIGLFAIVMLGGTAAIIHFLAINQPTPTRENITCSKLTCETQPSISPAYCFNYTPAQITCPGENITGDPNRVLTYCYPSSNITCKFIEDNSTICQAILHPQMGWNVKAGMLENCTEIPCPNSTHCYMGHCYQTMQACYRC